MSTKIVKPFLHLFYFKYLNIYLFFLPKGLFISNYFKYSHPLYFYKLLKPVKKHSNNINLISLFNKKTSIKYNINSIFNYFYLIYNQTITKLVHYNKKNIIMSNIRDKKDLKLNVKYVYHNLNFKKFNNNIVFKPLSNNSKKYFKSFKFKRFGNFNKFQKRYNFFKKFKTHVKRLLKKKLKKLTKLEHRNKDKIYYLKFREILFLKWKRKSFITKSIKFILTRNYWYTINISKHWSNSLKFNYMNYNLMLFSKFEILNKFLKLKNIFKLNNSTLNKKLFITTYLKKLYIFKAYFKTININKLILLVKFFKYKVSNNFKFLNKFFQSKYYRKLFLTHVYKFKQKLNLNKKKIKTYMYHKKTFKWLKKKYKIKYIKNKTLNDLSLYKIRIQYSTLIKEKKKKNNSGIKYIKTGVLLYPKIYNNPSFIKHKIKNLSRFEIHSNQFDVPQTAIINKWSLMFKDALLAKNKKKKIWINPTYKFGLFNHEYQWYKEDWRIKARNIYKNKKIKCYKPAMILRNRLMIKWNKVRFQRKKKYQNNNYKYNYFRKNPYTALDKLTPFKLNKSWKNNYLRLHTIRLQTLFKIKKLLKVDRIFKNNDSIRLLKNKIYSHQSAYFNRQNLSNQYGTNYKKKTIMLLKTGLKSGSEYKRKLDVTIFSQWRNRSQKKGFVFSPGIFKFNKKRGKIFLLYKIWFKKLFKKILIKNTIINSLNNIYIKKFDINNEFCKNYKCNFLNLYNINLIKSLNKIYRFLLLKNLKKKNWKSFFIPKLWFFIFLTTFTSIIRKFNIWRLRQQLTVYQTTNYKYRYPNIFLKKAFHRSQVYWRSWLFLNEKKSYNINKYKQNKFFLPYDKMMFLNDHTSNDNTHVLPFGVKKLLKRWGKGRPKRYLFKHCYGNILKRERAKVNTYFRLNFRYQHRMTRFLFRFKLTSVTNIFRHFCCMFVNIFLRSHLAPTVNEFNFLAKNNCIFLNGLVIKNKHIPVYSGDIIALTVNWYIFKYLKLIKLQLNNQKKQRLSYFYNFFMKRRLVNQVLYKMQKKDMIYKYQDVPYFLETDLTTLTSIMILNPSISYLLANNYWTFNQIYWFSLFQLNWKYIM